MPEIANGIVVWRVFRVGVVAEDHVDPTIPVEVGPGRIALIAGRLATKPQRRVSRECRLARFRKLIDVELVGGAVGQPRREVRGVKIQVAVVVHIDERAALPVQRRVQVQTGRRGDVREADRAVVAKELVWERGVSRLEDVVVAVSVIVAHTDGLSVAVTGAEQRRRPVGHRTAPGR